MLRYLLAVYLRVDEKKYGHIAEYGFSISNTFKALPTSVRLALSILSSLYAGKYQFVVKPFAV